MPQTLGLFLFQLGAPIGVVNTVVGIGGAAAGFFGSTVGKLALSLGLSFLGNALTGLLGGGSLSSPSPEDVQQSFRQAAAPRVKHYGRVKVSGPWVFGESYQGDFYKVIALGGGPVDAIEQLWIDDTQVTVDGSFVVQTAPWTGVARIETRLGLATESYYSHLAGIFSEWTSAHRGDYIASLYARQYAVDSADYLSTFPNGINTSYRVVMRGALLTPVGGGVAAWGENAAAIIYDYMRSMDGMRLPAAVLDTTEAQAGWNAAIARCNQDVNLNAGGTEKRYRIWGSYRLDERPADVLARMLAACDGRLRQTSDGGLTLDVGDWSEPSVTLDQNAIVGISELSRGRDVLTTANTIRATYMEPTSDYQTQDADPWVDTADVSDRGEIAADLSLIMAPSHTQARRLMKLASYRLNPNWVGTFECNLSALAVVGERFVRITYPRFSIDEVLEIQDVQLNFAQGDTLTSVTVTAQSMPQAAYQWDETQDEGDAPETDTVVVDNSIPVPTDFNVKISTTVIGSNTVPVALLEYDAPPSPSLTVGAQGKLASDSAWTDISAGNESATSFALSEDDDYEFRVRHITTGLREGDWTAVIPIKADTDTTAPTAATSVSGTGGVGEADIDFTSPADTNYACQNIYRNSTNDEGTATLIARVFGDASTAETYTDTVAAGTYYYWVKSRNTLGDESSSVATGAVLVS